MSVKFKNGELVTQIVPAPVEGKIVRFSFDENSGEIQYVVGWLDSEGMEHERAFSEDQIESTTLSLET